MKPKVIIITGQIAALKSTIAEKLANDFSAFLLCKDLIKEQIAFYVKTRNREENLGLSKASVALMNILVSSLLPHVETIIVEANFKKDEYLNLIQTLDSKNIHYKTIYCYGEMNILYKRYLNRLPHLNQTHQAMGLISENQFLDSMQYYNNVFGSLNSIISLDTSYFNDEVYVKLLEQINND
ncbi:MAG: hypothetical protein ACNA7U_06010 [Candidatus Izemoplasmataceae bacterium]|jgi:hypothetical protein|uniref:hypothetical protein n=1 Tax=Liberiplasma polymorphum TaxID=3374570 RepID=UPI003770DBBD